MRAQYGLRSAESGATVYIVHTPYHVFLSLLLASPGECVKFLFISEDRHRWEPYISFIEALYGRSSALVLPIWRARSASRLSFGRLGAGASAYHTFARSIGPGCHIHVFNDSDVESQVLLSVLKPSQVTHVEDGSFSYVNYHLEREPIAEAVKSIVSLGSYHSTDVIGATRMIDDRLAIYPDRVRKELRPALPLEITPAGLERLKSLAEFLQTPLPSGDIAIVTLPLEELGDREGAWYEKVITELEATGLRVCIKEHPREMRSEQLRFSHHFKVSRFVPLELLVLQSEAIKVVVGAANTSSIVLGALRPSLEIKALMKGVWSTDSYARETLRQLQVEVHDLEAGVAGAG